jgi:RNA polymerase sigma-70 factor (ECF subfamily)
MDITATLSTLAARRPSSLPEDLEATRASLLERLKDAADHEGWQRFFRAYAGVIHGFALRSGLSRSDADEVLQETMISVAAEMPGFQYDPTRGRFKSWLFQIVRRRIADQCRKRARQQRWIADSREAEELPEAAAEDPLQAAWEEEWRATRLARAIERVKARVSLRQWQMFELTALQGWPADRVSAVVGGNRAQVYMAKMRVGRLLKEELDAEHSD